jgi:anti-sigma regulatory factor (Ser/Thr protein kinase)
VKIYFPNSGHLQNFAGFARQQDASDASHLEFSMHPSYVSVHPVALSMAASAAAQVKRAGGTITANLPASDASLQYIARMRLTDALGVKAPVVMREHAPEGRFIPVTAVADQEGLNDFIITMVPLLHASPQDAGPIKYVITELVRNVLEHAASPTGALVCAQYFKKTNRLSLGVADMGIGIRKSISRFHPAPTDLAAIQLALRPGISGATGRLGGNEQNAGAGLFFTKSIARVSRNFFVVYSGTAMFKLRKGAATEQPTLLSDPAGDTATREAALPPWPGTAIGIDINVGQQQEFSQLLSEIRRAYSLDVRERKKDRYRRPRFS